MILIGEFVSRYYYGCATPVLYISDKQIEYTLKPSQNISYNSSKYIVNEYGMRGESFKPLRSAQEFRVLIFGDSVLNGGSQVDQSKLATTLLKERLEKLLSKPVVVGNVSAGSWGPGNWLAYVKKFGFFDADVVIVLISSHDASDNPTFQNLNPTTHPEKNPISGLLFCSEKFIGRVYENYIANTYNIGGKMDYDHTDISIRHGIDSLNKFLLLAKSHVSKVIIIQYPEQDELYGTTKPGFHEIKNAAINTGVSRFSAFSVFYQSVSNGVNPYRDNIHTNSAGQELLEKIFETALGF